MRIFLAAIDRSLERIAGGAREAVENELLNLALSVAHDNGPAFVFFRRDIPPDLR